MEISVVSAPMSTTMTPLALVTSRPAPMASAIGFSTIRILLGLALELATKSKNALFSTSVISDGVATTNSAEENRLLLTLILFNK